MLNIKHDPNMFMKYLKEAEETLRGMEEDDDDEELMVAPSVSEIFKMQEDSEFISEFLSHNRANKRSIENLSGTLIFYNIFGGHQWKALPNK